MINLIAKLKYLIYILQLIGEAVKHSHILIPRLVAFWNRLKLATARPRHVMVLLIKKTLIMTQIYWLIAKQYIREKTR